MTSRHLIHDIVARQYNEKRRFPDYDRAVKKLECHHRHSFLSCHPNYLEGIIHDYDVPVYICRFSPSNRDGVILAVANENGTVCVENTSKRRTRTYVQTHNNTVFDLAWMPGETQFVTVSGDHSAKLWDCGEGDVKVVSEFLGHTRSVKCVHFKPENTSVFATGSRDGSLILWDARCSRKCSKLPMAHTPDQIIPAAAGTSPYFPRRKYYPLEASQSNSVTGVLFQNDNTLISSGSSDQFIRVWDMRKTYSRSATLPLPKYQLLAPSNGFSHICINPEGTKMYANCMDSYIYCFNVNSYLPEPVSAFYGHQNGSFYVKSSISHDGLYLLSGSTDRYAYIWNTRNAEFSDAAIKPIAALPGHTAEVACVAMSSLDDIKVATCSDDGTYRLWYTYSDEKKKDRCEVIETAYVEDCGSTTSIRTEWKNGRKRGLTEDADDISPMRKNVHCTYHSKICRYYSNNLLAVSCRCQRLEILGLKRSLEESEEEREANQPEASKRRTELEMQETTPPRSNEIKTVNRAMLHDLKSPKKSIKVSLKRKLADLPNFSDDSECKKKAHDRVLVPLNGVNQSEGELNGVGVMNELKGTEFASLVDTELSAQPVDAKSEEDNADNEISPIFSSPTTNLPNYVHDGTSPYIHRCQRTQKENKDWLTKLRRNKLEVADKGEEKTDNSPKGASKVGSAGKRKLKRNGSTEDRNPTLHKYFKISSKPTEVGYLSQEVQKKTC